MRRAYASRWTRCRMAELAVRRRVESRWAAKPRPHSEFDSARVGGRAPVTHDGGLRHIEHTHTHTHTLAHPHHAGPFSRPPGLNHPTNPLASYLHSISTRTLTWTLFRQPPGASLDACRRRRLGFSLIAHVRTRYTPSGAHASGDCPLPKA